MNAPRSLSHFFQRTDSATLDTCDREQIHLCGQIQNLGALLVIDPASHCILGASANLPAFLGCDMADILDAPLATLDPDLAEQVAGSVEETQILHEVLEYQIRQGGVLHDTVTHSHDGRRIIEFIPNLNPSSKSVRTKMRQCSRACTRIIHAAHFDEALQIAADAVREITGFSRAKIYRFQADWAGEVIAESRNDSLPSYLGLCFPAADIPRQVREIMSIVPYRTIGTTSDAAIPIRAAGNTPVHLDLTWSVLRSVSTMHTAYLRNIKVGAAFSCSLMHQSTLWGLIAAHNTEPGLVPFDSWSLVQEIGASLMLRHANQQRTETADMISRLRQVENGFAAALRKDGEVEVVIAKLVPVLREFLGADGFAFQFGHNLHLSGRTPPPDVIRDLIQWAVKNRELSDQFQTNALQEQWPPAIDHIDTCCGVLIQPIVVHRVCQLIWFRGPITRTVRWAGKPDDKALSPGLGPRTSFETWVQEHKDQSAPWQEAELQSAREVFTEFLDILASQLLLKEENAGLRQFAAKAAHDLKAPLLGLRMALEWLGEDNFDPSTMKETHALAQQSSARMTELTEGLLELALLEEQTPRMDEVDVARIVADVRDLLTAQFAETGAQIEIADLPRVAGSERMILRLVLNLISNALKYRAPDRAPRIRVYTTGIRDTLAEFAIEDNGVGVHADYAQRIFLPMERLHSKDEIEGTGLGLAICKRIVAAHGGTILLDSTFRTGARFLFTLPRHAEARP